MCEMMQEGHMHFYLQMAFRAVTEKLSVFKGFFFLNKNVPTHVLYKSARKCISNRVLEENFFSFCEMKLVFNPSLCKKSMQDTETDVFTLTTKEV